MQVGEIGAPHGISGAVRVFPTTDFPERLSRLGRIWLDRCEGDGFAVKEWTVTEALVLLQLHMVASREQAETLRGRTLWIPQDELPALPSDTFYWHQLLGLAVYTVDQRLLGSVAHVRRRGSAHDFLEVTREGRKPLWIPLVRTFVDRVDVAGGCVWVSLPQGLEELE